MKYTFTTPLTRENYLAIKYACMWPIVTVEIKEAKRIRSLSQNSYYWGIVISSVTGMFNEHGTQASPEDVHNYLRENVGKLFKRINLPDGEIKTIGRSTTELTTSEFELYLEQIRAWAANYGLIIPLPNESV